LLFEIESVETWTDPIASGGGPQFRHMVLDGVGGCASVLLEASAETLERLRFNVTDGLDSEWFTKDLSTDSS
jgi:hypothetical protein